MRAKQFYLCIVAIFVAGMAVRLVPLAEYALIGDDLGRYIYQVNTLIEKEGLTYSFPGWGSQEAEFVGFYGFFGILVKLFGTSTVRTLSIAPLFSLIAIAMIMLLALKIFKDEKISLIAGAFLAVSPLFTLVSSRPVKAVLGFPLFGLCLLMLYFSYKDKRSLPILYASTIALVLTHNFTTYFLIIGVLSMVFFREIGRKHNDTDKLRVEIPYLAFLLIFSLAFALIACPTFRESFISTIQKVIPLPIWALFVLGAASLSVVPLVVRLGRKVSSRIKEREERILQEKGNRKGLKMAFITFGALSSIAVILLFVPLPIGLDYALNPLHLIWIVPTLLSISFAATGKQLCKGEENQFVYLTIAPLISLMIGLITQMTFLYPYRHGDYIAMTGFVLVGVALTRASVKRKKLLKYGTIALLVVCGLVAYPPLSIRLYDEGFTDGELAGAYWIAESGEIRPEDVIASDMGGSDLIFGIAKHENVTWNQAYWIFAAEEFNNSCREEVERCNISYVFVSVQMWRAGIVAKSAETNPGAGDYVVPEEEALLKFFDEPFILAYTYYPEYYNLTYDDYEDLMWDDESGELDIENLPRDAVWIFEIDKRKV